MLCFKYSTVGSEEREITVSSAEAILRAMQERPTWDGVTISPNEELGLDGAGQFPLLNLSWYPDHGYEIQCFESAQRPDSDFLATSDALSPPEVYVELGGQGQELWPRELFVPFESALRATKYLLTDGREDPGLAWILISEFPRQPVSRRRGKTP